MMNTLTIFVLVVFLIFITIGFRRGLVKSVVKIVFAGMSLLLAYFLTPLISNILTEHTQIDDFALNKVYAAIESSVNKHISEELKNAGMSAEPAVVDEMTQITLKTELTKNQQIDMLYNIDIPEFIRDALVENNYDEMHQSLGAGNFYDYIAIYISRMIVNAIAFVITFIVVGLVFCIIYIILAIVVELPVISGFNRFGGIIFGILQSLIIVWLIFAAAALSSRSDFAVFINSQIDESMFLTMLNDHNIFMTIMGKLVKIG